jgi:hypothetical protein
MISRRRISINALALLAMVGMAVVGVTTAKRFMDLRAGKPAAPESPQAGPLMADKTDALIVDTDGDGNADPGDKIRYTVTVNSMPGHTGVQFDDMVDANTAFMAGSTNVSPLAFDDSYDTIGNTLLKVGVAAGSDPEVVVPGGSIFNNDTEFLGDTFTLKSVEGVNFVAVSVTAATEQGGSVTVNANGTFSYTPPVGFTGTDNFDYVITDDGVGGLNALTGSGRVTLNVTSMVWYVKNNAPAGGLGRSSDPFGTLVEAQTASAAGHTIYVFNGDGTTTGQNAGITLKNLQRFVGEGVALTMPVSVNGGPNPTTLRAAGTKPRVNNAAGNGAQATDAIPIEIVGLSLSGSVNAIDLTLNAAFAGTGTMAIKTNTIFAAGAEGIDINMGGTGTLTMDVQSNIWTTTAASHVGNAFDALRTLGALRVAFSDNTTITSTASGVVINGSVGGAASTHVTGFSNNTVHQNTVGTGMIISNVTFDATPGGAYNQVAGGTTAVGVVGDGVGAAGIVMTTVSGDLAFTDLDIVASNGVGLNIVGTGAVNTGAGTGTRVTVGAGVGTIVATGGPAVDIGSIANITIDLQLLSLQSTNSPTMGVLLTNVLDGTTVSTFSAGSGSSITNATNTDFRVSGGNATITYNGTITDDIGELVLVAGHGADTIIFTGAITDGDDGDGSGVSLVGNSGSTIRFMGGLVLSTGANPAFAATGGAAAVEVCDENPCNPAATGALINKLTTTTGTALNVTSTTIGSNNLEFRSIDANGAVNGIVLTTTGSSGGLKVKGNSSGSCGGAITLNPVGTPSTFTAPVVADCTGGTIQNTTAAGISLNSTANTSLNRMRIINSATDEILIATINGFTLDHSAVSDSAGVAGDRGIELGDFSTGTAVNGTINILNSTLGPTPHDNMGVGIASGTSTWNFTSSVFTGSVLNSGLNFEIRNATVSAFVMDGSILNGQFADGMQIQPASGVAATITSATIQNSTITNNNIGIDLNHDGSSNVTYKVLNNTLRTHQAQAINVFTSATAGVSGNLNARITGNFIGTAGTVGSGSALGNGIRVNGNQNSTKVVLLDGNTIRQTPNGRGIEVINRNGTGGMDVTATNNDVNPQDTSGFPLSAIFVQTNCLATCNSARSDVRSNTVPAGAATGELLPTFIALVETGASALSLIDTPPADATCTSQLISTNTGSASASAGCALIAGPIGTPP